MPSQESAAPGNSMSGTGLYGLLFVAGLLLGIVVESHFAILQSHDPQRASAAGSVPATGETVADVISGGEKREISPVGGSKSQAARLSVDSEIHNFGIVETGTVVSHEFHLTNSGGMPLQVKSVRPDCGCTLAEITKNLLKPGESTTILAHLNLEGRVGPQQRAVLVTTDSENQPFLQLQLIGESRSRVAVTPNLLDLHRLPRDGVRFGTATVSTTEGLQLSVAGVQTSEPALTGVLREPNGAVEMTVDITLRWTPELKNGVFHGWVKLLTNDPGPYSQIMIPVQSFVGEGGPLLIGDKAEVSGPAAVGGAVSLEGMTEKLKLVVFWASWSESCRREIPGIIELTRRYEGKGLGVLGIATDAEESDVLNACSSWSVPWPNIHIKGDGTQSTRNPLAEKYQIRELPALFLVDKDGIVIARSTRLESLQETIRELLSDEALSATLVPVSAEVSSVDPK